MIQSSAFRVSRQPAVQPVDVYISAGSNIEPARHLRMAIAGLRERFGPVSLSGIYRNPAEGFDGDDFLNLVIRVTTLDSPRAIIDTIELLHERSGRVRGSNPFSSRTLDLDLLMYGDRVIDEEKVRVPREDITDYAFVLGPMAEMAPRLEHPVTGRTMADMWQSFTGDKSQLKRLRLNLT